MQLNAQSIVPTLGLIDLKCVCVWGGGGAYEALVSSESRLMQEVRDDSIYAYIYS